MHRLGVFFRERGKSQAVIFTDISAKYPLSLLFLLNEEKSVPLPQGERDTNKEI